MVFMPLFSRALLVGAANNDRKLSFGFRSASQIGQVGHSELLLKVCPFDQVFCIL